ncbi:wHTH domain-containing protein [Streptomyces sp. NBC_01429]|uniref:wHTH domain-containing protein n=1 Tax=Streptomyces sp. NBC_01429 TaxID=2903862 RepID=UPI003FCC9F52
MRHTPGFEDPDDLRITSLRLDGGSPWRTSDATVPYGHVLYATGATYRRPRSRTTSSSSARNSTAGGRGRT